MDADQVLRHYLGLKEKDSFECFTEEQIVEIITIFAIWPLIDSYKKSPWLARYAVRSQRQRVDDRVPGEKRDLWGIPDESGFFTDDNSLLKSTYKNQIISGLKNPYGENRISSGLVCCHIWPKTTGDSLLFSFLPNLVWVPKSLSRFTDVFNEKPIHKAHFVLQEISYARYKKVQVLTGERQADIAWSRITRPNVDFEELPCYTEFISEPSLSNRVNTRHYRLLEFLGAALANDPKYLRRFSKRYHLGKGSGIDITVPPITELVTKKKIIELIEILEQTSPKLLI